MGTSPSSTGRRTWGQRARRAMLLLGLGILGFVVLGCVGLLAGQRKMIYFPARYEPSYKNGLPKGTAELAFSTKRDGRQVAFYVPSRDGNATPEHLWVMFHGNAARAQDWLDFVEDYPATNTAFLLVDLPGYGLCEGSPSRTGAIANAEGAFDETARLLNIPAGDLSRRTRVLGFSMGCAVALEFASRHAVDRVVLMAPYTSLMDMARRQVGWPLCQLLIDRYDNRARLDELAERTPTPAVHIFHGIEDDIIPHEMSKELAARHPAMIELHLVEKCDHNWLPDRAQGELFRLMPGE